MTATRATLRSRPPRQLSLGLLPRRAAVVGVRQSSPTQVQHHRESTRRQYALLERARALGWPPECVQVIDADLGCSGASTAGRHGFAYLTSEVVLGLEVSRLARNSADWYRLLDRCALSNTLLGDSDGVYHPALYNDRLLLGLKGTMSEAELHLLRERLLEGARAKAARGELRCRLPAGYIWGCRTSGTDASGWNANRAGSAAKTHAQRRMGDRALVGASAPFLAELLRRAD